MIQVISAINNVYMPPLSIKRSDGEGKYMTSVGCGILTSRGFSIDTGYSSIVKTAIHGYLSSASPTEHPKTQHFLYNTHTSIHFSVATDSHPCHPCPQTGILSSLSTDSYPCPRTAIYQCPALPVLFHACVRSPHPHDQRDAPDFPDRTETETGPKTSSGPPLPPLLFR